MGLLDDAIREHLELKRRRGADPGAVAREEQDALGPVHRGDAELKEMDDRSSAVADDQEALGVPDSPSVVGSTDSGGSSQETVEINMEAELAAEQDSDDHAKTELDARARPVAHPASVLAISDQSLKWEAPDRAEEIHPNIELGGGPDGPVGGDKLSESVEDVLEETPEQERLWFEQRPPRDFDFND
jgi:hypothetical protein